MEEQAQAALPVKCVRALRLNGFQLCDLSPLLVSRGCLIREAPLETQGSSAAGRLDGFSSQSSSPERKRFAHTVWLQSWCLCCVSINVSDYDMSLF